jgi:hypothetical protein
MLNNNYYLSNNIINKLYIKLNKARENIKKNKIIYKNEEHKEICECYKKYYYIIENKFKYKNNLNCEKLKNEDKKICECYKKFLNIKNNLNKKYNYFNLFNYLKLNNIYKEIFKLKFTYFNIKNNKIQKIPIIYNYTNYYNIYNEKFINNIKYNSKEIKLFISNQITFFESLTIEELYTLKYYTYIGDKLLNTYIKGIFDPKKINTLYIKGRYFYFSHYSDSYLLLYYQFKYVFEELLIKENYIKIFRSLDNYNYLNKFDKKYFNKYILENYKNFEIEIYHLVFEKFINDLINIFNKAPIANNIICYRGLENKFFNNIINIKKGYYTNSTFISTSLFIDVAKKFTLNNNGYIQKININSNKVIFMELITLNNYEFEILLPINSKLYIDYPFRKMILYNTTNERNLDYICDNENNKTYEIMDNILINNRKINKYELDINILKLYK